MQSEMLNKRTNERIIIFTRVPEPGRVKTRLLGALSPGQCAGLHSAFLADTLRTAQASGRETVVWYAPASDLSPLLSVSGPVRVEEQRGKTLGERMAEAFKAELAACGAAVLIGSDIPRLTDRHIDGIFSALAECDVALSPSGDGGYSLIGMKATHSAPFNITGYGGATVLENTLHAAADAGLSCRLTERCDDVDTPADLAALCAELRAGKISAPNTEAWLRSEGILKRE